MDPAKTLVEAGSPGSRKGGESLLEPTPMVSIYLQKTTNHTLIFQLPKELIPELNRQLVQLRVMYYRSRQKIPWKLIFYP